ncbi:hypothetical protein BDV25DRAFT_137838 [Aspergillus avenaceus]|uniref:Uncharacterized protein n=1 Tax=Aspergillus avenaceus TaxID=36643 RepID=A0A5N6U282_ASPAV|nr:hypothetical protein BDV25DRAFT_137838 [Aspergillus avenaceus]
MARIRYPSARSRRAQRSRALATRRATGSTVEVEDHKGTSEEERMSSALHEALNCDRCRITLTPDLFQEHCRTGVYSPIRDPPFLSDRVTSSVTGGSKLRGPVAVDIRKMPLRATVPFGTRPGYGRRLTKAQCKEYSDQVKRYESEDADGSWMFARYRIDYHVHAHYMAQRGPIGLCRDAGDKAQLRCWYAEWAGVKIQERETLARPHWFGCAVGAERGDSAAAECEGAGAVGADNEGEDDAEGEAVGEKEGHEVYVEEWA